MIKRNDILFNNERNLFETKFFNNNNDNTNIFHTQNRIIFRNKEINNILNKNNNPIKEFKYIENKKLDNCSNCSIEDKNYKDIFKFNNSNLLKLPTLSEKLMKVKDLITKRRFIINKKFESIYKIINNDEFQKIKYIESIMQGCCNIEKINSPQKNRINNSFKDYDEDYNLSKTNFFYKNNFSFRNKEINNKTNYKNFNKINNSYNKSINKTNASYNTPQKSNINYYYNNININKNNNNNFNRYKCVRYSPSYNLFKKNIKKLVNKETMTDFNKDNNMNNCSSDYSNLFNKKKDKIENKLYFKSELFNNFNSNPYKTLNI